MNITLTVQGGPQSGRAFTFDHHDTFIVGRGEDVHFRLPDDPSLSRKHFLLEVNPPLCRLRDLNSRSGTRVNGQRVTSTDLSGGERIHAGQTVFVVTIERASEVDPDSTLPGPQELPITTAHWEDVGLPVIPGYEVRSEIARGGMGIVYEGVRRGDGERVAIKTLLPAVAPTRFALERFIREARILQDLTHPNIVRFVEIGEVNRLLWFVMEFVAGTDCARHVREHGPFEIGTGVRLGLELLDALTYAHAKKFVHRDIKPNNVLLTPPAGGRFGLKLSDFGLARTYQASQISGLTVTGTSAGTPLYMSPEQVRHFRDVKPAADQYSAAATLYFMLTGRTVFEPQGEYVSVMLQVLEGKLIPIRERRGAIPEGLAKVIHKALSPVPDDRYPDVNEFAKALKPYATP